MDRTAPPGPVHRGLLAALAGAASAGGGGSALAPPPPPRGDVGTADLVTAPPVCAGAPTSGSRLWIQWTLARRGRPTIVSFAGEVGAANSDSIVDTLQAVLESGAPGLILDLTGVRFLDGHGDPVMLAARRQAEALSIRLDLVCGADMRAVVLRQGGESETLCLHPTVTGALAARRRGHDHTGLLSA